MPAMTLSTCDRALPADGTAPEWVHLLPAGHIVARDGREFDLPDPAALVLVFEQGGIDLPIDYEHQNDKPEAKLKGPVPAAGWIKKLTHDESGLWGHVEWTRAARDMIAQKEYRFLSPSFFCNRAGQIMRLAGAGLVHNPALHLKALASREDTMPLSNSPAETASPLVARLLRLLNLPPGTPEDEAAEMLDAWMKGHPSTRPDPKDLAPTGALAEMVRSCNLERASLSEERAVAEVNAIIDEGWIFPGLKSWAVAHCMEDPESFRAFMSMTKIPSRTPPWAHLRKELLAGPPPSERLPNEPHGAMATICARPGLTADQISKA